MSSYEKLTTDSTVKPRREPNSRIVQNFILVWLDSQVDEMDANDIADSIIELQRVVNTIKLFIDPDECFNFVTEIKEEKILIIVSAEFASNIVPVVHNIPQINSFYVFCSHQVQDKKWINQWPKVKNIFRKFSSLCQTVKEDIQKCEQDAIPISFISRTNNRSNENVNQPDPTFMYTQILKELLLTINFNEQHIKEFISYYRENFANNPVQLDNIGEFEKNYNSSMSIKWYTQESCLYSMLNRALRMMEVDTIIKMGFFIRDLHQQIVELYAKQVNTYQRSESFTLYRGQGLSKKEFDTLQQTSDGLISFNNFLSTTRELNVALDFARRSAVNPDSVGIIFVMTIDPSIKSTPFALIKDDSHYKTEEEILFSMHTVFRISDAIAIPNDNNLWQVDLIQTDNNDSQLNALTARIRNEIKGTTEWDRLGKLLIKLGEFNKAEELYQVLIDQTDNERGKIHLYHQLGWSKKKHNQYDEAILYYEKALEIKRRILPQNHYSFTASYNDLGSVYEMKKEYTKALLHYENGLAIELNRTPLDQADLALFYSKIGSIYEKTGEYQKALSFYEKAIEIRQNMSPKNKIQLAYSYSYIGSVYEKMKKYSEALSSYQKALEIQQKLLPSSHPDLAQSHSNIGHVYFKMGQYRQAQEYHQSAFDIGRRSLPDNHRQLQTYRKNLDYIKKKV